MLELRKYFEEGEIEEGDKETQNSNYKLVTRMKIQYREYSQYYHNIFVC